MKSYSGKAEIIFELQAQTAQEVINYLKSIEPTLKSLPKVGNIKYSISETQAEIENQKLLMQERQRIHNRYPDSIMKTLREAQGLNENDTSHDEELNTYSPNEVLSEILNYEGYINAGSYIKSTIEDIYNIDLDKITSHQNETNNNLSPIQQYVNELNKNKRNHNDKSFEQEI